MVVIGGGLGDGGGGGGGDVDVDVLLHEVRERVVSGRVCPH